MTVALILFAHGARDPAWAEPVRRVQVMIQARNPSVRVEVAFLEFIAPSLADSGAVLADEGFSHIIVLPMFIAQGGHLKREVPEIMASLSARYPNVIFDLAPPVGEVEAVVQAMADAALGVLNQRS